MIQTIFTLELKGNIHGQKQSLVFQSLHMYFQNLQIAMFYTLIWVGTTFAHGLASLECVRVNIKHNVLSFR